MCKFEFFIDKEKSRFQLNQNQFIIIQEKGFLKNAY